MISRPLPSCVVHDGRLPATGTVSRWPAITTRSDRLSSVRARTTLPSRSTVKWSCGRERLLDPIGDLCFVAADRLDVDQCP